MKNKKGINYSNVLIGFALFAMIILAFTPLITDTINSYGLSGSDQASQDYANIQKLENLTSDLSDQVQEGTIDEGTGFFESIGKQFVSAGKLLFSLPSIIIELVDSVSFITIPVWLKPILSLMITISIVMAVLAFAIGRIIGY